MLKNRADLTAVRKVQVDIDPVTVEPQLTLSEQYATIELA